MKKDKAKIEYESPQTRKTLVSLESGICASSIVVNNPNDEQDGKIESHKVNEDFGFTFEHNDWDSEVQQ